MKILKKICYTIFDWARGICFFLAVFGLAFLGLTIIFFFLQQITVWLGEDNDRLGGATIILYLISLVMGAAIAGIFLSAKDIQDSNFRNFNHLYSEIEHLKKNAKTDSINIRNN